MEGVSSPIFLALCYTRFMLDLKEYGIEMWEADKIASFREKLLTWYDENKRDLPWRRTNNPYHIWVSEIMLQQTRVDTVIPYYERFLDWFPSVADLAQAPEDRLLKAWEGLGYYSRVRNMQKAAQQIMTDFAGKFPDSYEGIASLKGIGPYTAAAIASMAFGRVAPALDGNLFRIVARLFRLKDDIALPRSRKVFMEILDVLIDPDRPGDFNQAMMDLGACVMTPSNPRPDNHPLAVYDASYQVGDSDQYPVKSKKVKQTRHDLTAYFLVDSQGNWLLRRHGEAELLTGLWHFPMLEQSMIYEEVTDAEMTEPLLDWLREEALVEGDSPLSSQVLSTGLGQVKHVFSHRIWQVQLVGLRLDTTSPLQEGWCWVAPEDVGQLPLSTLQEKLMQALVHEREAVR